MHRIAILSNKTGKNGGCHDEHRDAVFNCNGQSCDFSHHAIVANGARGDTANSRVMATMARVPWAAIVGNGKAGKVGNSNHFPTIPRVGFPTLGTIVPNVKGGRLAIKLPKLAKTTCAKSPGGSGNVGLSSWTIPGQKDLFVGNED